MNRIREHRIEMGMLHPELADALQEVEPRIDVGMISRYERGVCLPTVEQAGKLCEVLKCDLSELFDVEDIDFLRLAMMRRGKE